MNETVKVWANSGYDPVSFLNNTGIQRLQHDVGETNRDVKDAEAEIRYGIKDSEADIRYAVKDSEADIRHDVLFEGQENQKTSLEVEARLKDRLTIDRNAWDLQFQNLNNRMADNEKEVIKQGYESRIEALRTSEKTDAKIAHISERLADKFEHGFEEIREDLVENAKEAAECCCKLEKAIAVFAAKDVV